ncbi:MAG TPA: SMC-Scp complex subunit ScpB [Bosea sp. (in: a-proteobacteria)]|jgi:segregation and condensation protein B|uniref:SMC-Scp complex subunit ScpB n=1 Tax=Bosea sp. (in: a-proteobacteria) TaxID=1871050 RepID=UPI002E105E15|nr:SMC-Scp complex subunit ScpB [Bosea sp. (in: a-proteobacteria)]
MSRRPRSTAPLDTELADLPADLRWREWMGRVEAVIFASPEPVTREMLARVVGQGCSIDLIIDDIRDELRGRPYELVTVAGGWQMRSRKSFAATIRVATGLGEQVKPLSPSESLTLMAIGYFQPITRSELSQIFGKEVSRDTIGQLRRLGFVAAGPRSPQPGAPYTYVTTKTFLSHFGFDTLRDLPDMEALEDAGLLSKDRLLAGEIPVAGLGHSNADDGDGHGSDDASDNQKPAQGRPDDRAAPGDADGSGAM